MNNVILDFLEAFIFEIIFTLLITTGAVTFCCVKLRNTINIKKEGNNFFVKGNQSYKAINKAVEGDMSNAAFLYAFNALGGNVTVKGINENTLQGDRVYKEIIDTMIEKNETFDVSDCPD